MIGHNIVIIIYHSAHVLSNTKSCLRPMIRSLKALERSTRRNHYPRMMKMSSSSSSPVVLKPWPKPMVESHGDYREEEFLEKHIGGPLYEHQATLPRLPVLEVNDTIQKLIPTVLPLSSSPSSSDLFIQRAKSFEQQSIQLQQRLVASASTDYKDSSWLQHWWNVLGYLSVRDSIVINVSYFFHLSDDPTLPISNTNNNNNNNKMILRSACVLHAIAKHRLLVCSGEMPQESIGKGGGVPLCSVAFKYMFHSCRIPRRGKDSYRMYDPSLHAHVIVARHGRFYAMNFVDEITNEPLPLAVLTNQLQQIIAANNNASSSSLLQKIGWLTTQDRDSWADAREELLSIGGIAARDALEMLESGAILLCLDDDEPVSRKQCGQHFLHGSPRTSFFNRWYDKSIQIICCKNGKVGLVGEHSMMDGAPVVGLADRITRTTYASIAAAEEQKHQHSNKVSATSDGVQDIFGECERLWRGTQAEISVEKAKQSHCAVIDDQHLHVQSFQAYGSDQIKKMGYSPDAFVQMAIQLATYRLWGEQGATYEASQVRIFLHGRTETTRSVSHASAAFCTRMGLVPTTTPNEILTRVEKVALLQMAVKSHVAYMSDAAKGKGVDRHLLGLSLSLAPQEKAPDLFSDPLYQKAKTWRVSTSHLTHPKFENWGFGQVVPHGVGIAYSVQKNSCMFNLTALKKWDWTERLSHLLEEALLEVRDLHSEDGSPPQLGSKL